MAKKSTPKKSTTKKDASTGKLQFADDTMFKFLSESAPLADTTEWLSTNMPNVDVLLTRGKGVPFGKIIEIYGKEASGKTALCQYLIGEVQKAGGYAFYIDFEASYDSEHVACYNIDKKRLLYYAPETAEEAFTGMFQVLDNSKKYEPFIIVVDSVAAMVADAEKSDDAKTQVAGVPRVMSNKLRKLLVRLAGKRGFVVFTNQIRDKINTTAFGEKTTRPGGHALDFYSSIIINTYAKDFLKVQVDGKDRNTGFVISMINKKNRKGIPKESTEVVLSFETGVSAPLTTLRALLREGVLKKRGTKIVYESEEYTKDTLLEKIKTSPDEFGKLYLNHIFKQSRKD